MDHRTRVVRIVTFGIMFVILGTIAGGLLHSSDPPNYAEGALGILAGENIYEYGGVVYPPLLYFIAAIPLFIISQFVELTVDSYPTIAVFAGIGAVAQSISYILGSVIIDNNRHKKWIFASLLNPFVLYVVILYGQMESFIILGIIGVIYATYTDRWKIGGVLLAIAGAVKIYPLVLFLPFVWHNRGEMLEILKGAVPIGALTFALMIPYLPESLKIVSTPSRTGVRPMNALYIFSASLVSDQTVSLLFIISLLLTTIYACSITTEERIEYLLPLVPVVLFYPDIIEYRWLPLAVGALFIGYISFQEESQVSDVCKRYGWIWSTLGTLAMIVGAIEGWYEGAPWLVPISGDLTSLPVIFGMWTPPFSFGPLDGNPILFERIVLRIIRTMISLIFIITVLLWCGHIYQTIHRNPIERIHRLIFSFRR